MTLDQPAWLAIGFVVFIYFAYKPTRNAILAGLDSKINQIRREVEEAKNLPQQAEETLNQVKTEIAHASTQLEVDLVKSRAEIKQIIADKSIELDNLLRQKEIDSKQRINYITENAIKQIHSEQIENARIIVENYLAVSAKSQTPSDMEIAHKLLVTDKKSS